MKVKHWLVFILLGAIWSSSFMWIKLALREVSPDVLVAFRVLFGLIFGIIAILIMRIPLPRNFKTWRPILILGITNLAVPFFLISWGEQSVDSSVAAILDSTVPLFTIFIAHFLLDDDKMTLQKIFGLIVGFTGVVILLSKDISSSSGSMLGQAAVIAASVFYAISGVYARKMTQDIPGILRSTGPLLSASLVMWLAVFTAGKNVYLPILEITWIALLFLGVIGSGVAFVLAYYLIHEIGPTRTSMVTYLFPLGGVILGVIFLHEMMTWQLITGGLVIISSLIITNLNTTAKKILT